MARYVFHIGPHKTGSTYLQNSFLKGRDALRGNNVFYPTIWLGDASGHHLLTDQIKRRDASAIKTALNSLSSFDGTILISSETLSDLDLEDWRFFKSMLAPLEPTFVFYCRRWSELIPSCWQEAVKQGASTTFPEFYASRIADPQSSNIINYHIVLQAISEHFGMQSVKLISYSNLRDNKIDILVHFLQNILEIMNYQPAEHTIVNKSFEPVDVEIIRIFNLIQRLKTGNSGPPILERYMSLRGELGLDRVAASMSSNLDTLVINEDSIGLRKLFSNLSDTYGHNLVKPNYGPSLFESRARSTTFVSSSYLLIPGIVEALYRAYDRIQAVVEEGWYLTKYPDVKQAIESGIVKSAAEHFEKHGAKEGRRPSPDDQRMERHITRAGR